MDRGLDWYRRDPIAFIDGAQGMGPERIGAYAIIIDLIYARAGRTRRDDRHLAGVLGCSVRMARSLTSQLIELGKLSETPDGWLLNATASSDAKSRRERSEKAAKAGRKGGEMSGRSRKNKALGEASASSTDEATASNAPDGAPEAQEPGFGDLFSAETHAKHTRIGDESVTNHSRIDDETEGEPSKINGVTEAGASSREEKRREEEDTVVVTNGEVVSEPPDDAQSNNNNFLNQDLKGEDPPPIDPRLEASGMGVLTGKDLEFFTVWEDELGLSIEDQVSVIGEVLAKKREPGPPNTMAYFDTAMRRRAALASMRAQPEAPAEDPNERKLRRAQEAIESGHRWMCTHVTAHTVRELLHRGTVSEEQCRAVGVDW